jgi:long-chain fatty acid transport protein
MKAFAYAVGALTVSASAVTAGGVDRSGQSIGILFEQGNYVELSYGVINPNVSGKDNTSAATASGSVADEHNLPGVALKYEISDRLSAALIYDQAYGADIEYPNFTSAAGTGSAMLGGTHATVDSAGLTALLRYKFDQGFSAHGGLRVSRASGEVGLSGAAYSSLSGYEAKLDSDWGTGYVLGVAYERPEIALRVALTYFSKITHKFNTVETLPTSVAALFGTSTVNSVTEVDTPQAVNLDFQTGIAPDTLLFGSVRWVDWSNFKIDTQALVAASGSGLVDLEDTTTYTLGVGRKFNENWSGSVFVTYEPGGDKLKSPLAPTAGYRGIGLAAVYTQDNMKISMGVRYLDLGDADAQTAGSARVAMRDNHAVAVGVKIGFYF